MASKYLQKYPVPSQFPDILHDFAREVLRDQPANINDYGFQYFKALEEGTKFEYKGKGRAIPPPKDRKPQHSDYKEISPSPNAHIPEERERPPQVEEQPVVQEQQQEQTEIINTETNIQNKEKVLIEEKAPSQPVEQEKPTEQKLNQDLLEQHNLKPENQEQVKGSSRASQMSQEELDANNYVNNLFERVSKQSAQEEEKE